MSISSNTRSSRAVGICLGASTISIVQRKNGKISFSRISHGGKVEDSVRKIIHSAVPSRVGITGRKFRDLMNIETVSEPEAVELAYDHIREVYPGKDTILSVGSESFLVYTLDRKGRIKSLNTGSKCASGTGEFFLQQIKRMELDVEDAITKAASSEPHHIAGRCSVFSKSDCTHALNKGIEKGRVVAGLCRMMAAKIIELLKAAKARRIIAVGGVSQNKEVMRYLKEAFPEICIPEEAPYFEALGSMLWAEKNGILARVEDDIIKESYNSFPSLPDLITGESRVSFKTAPAGEFYDGEYVIGLDVGSTTTKAVLTRTDNQAIVASKYLRTLGDPVQASRNCYQALAEQVPEGIHPNIIGLGVTGSGRQIAGLHALTDEVINEIMAHAAAAVYFDPEVDTIFEIGGQDAKYTYITNGVPTDYAMNEACSAGTGSFLEEACSESFGIDTDRIADIALESTAPPNFNDQCAAFIGSDVKTAMQEGYTRENSVAGLVYSVCRNYLNRVKGSRPVGKKIFMQGGVSYNRAVPLAMAILCEQEIIVPPEPGLMGAFGAALEVHRKITNRLTEKKVFDLAELAGREIKHEKPFNCAGGREKCDRKCSIDRYSINGKKYPFGGACNKYYSYRQCSTLDAGELDLVRVREDLIFRKYAPQSVNGGQRTVGIPTSLYTTTAYPLYAHFFVNLGLRIIKSDDPDPEGFDSAGSSFCFPVLQSHGFLKEILSKEPDYIFIPQVNNAYGRSEDGINCTCPFVQSEPYYLRAAFHDKLDSRLLTEVLNFSHPKKLQEAFIRIGRKLGVNSRRSADSFEKAWDIFKKSQEEMKEHGRRFLSSLDPSDNAIVLFGRSYNAFAGIGNMGVPQKLASRGFRIIPHDFLPTEEPGTTKFDKMFWASGQKILQAAEFIKKRPNLSGVYITNFSCGPDSFIIEQFKSIMGQKPFLTLEFDDHTADAGIDTRIEAFLDVIRGYREQDFPERKLQSFLPAQTTLHNGIYCVRTSDDRMLNLTDPDIRLVIPSMGETASRALVSALQYMGIHATALDPPGQTELEMGKKETSCKECLPYTLITGSLLHFLEKRKRKDEVLVYYIPETDGPCRLGQYSVALKEYIMDNRISNVALLSLSSENRYAGMPPGFTSRAILATIISDGLEDIHAGILALADDRAGALRALEEGTERILYSLARDSQAAVIDVMGEAMTELAGFRKKMSLNEATKISLTGEIYARRDGLSSQFLVQKLAKKGIVVKTAPINEWLQYVNYIAATGILPGTFFMERLKAKIKGLFMKRMEALVRDQLRLSGFSDGHKVDIEYLIKKGSSLINPEFTGEAILTTALALKEIGDQTHGVISIGPFGCMPSRIAESILNHRFEDEKPNFSKKNADFWKKHKNRLSLPFLAIETDGNTFPQLTEARLESLILSANRLKEDLKELKS